MSLKRATYGTSLKHQWRLYVLVLSATAFLHDAPYLAHFDDKIFCLEKVAFAALHYDSRAAHIRFSMLRARLLVCLTTATFLRQNGYWLLAVSH